MHGHRRLRGSEESRRHRKTSRHHENGSLLGLFGEEREEEEKEEKEEEERARGQHRYDKYGTQDARWPLRMYEKQLDEFQKRINSFSVSAPMVNVSLRVSPFSPLPFLLSLSPPLFLSFFLLFFLFFLKLIVRRSHGRLIGIRASRASAKRPRRLFIVVLELDSKVSRL